MESYRLVRSVDGTQSLNDGRKSVPCSVAMAIVGVARELESCNCKAEIRDGILVLEDDTSYDLRSLLQKDFRNSCGTARSLTTDGCQATET